MKIVNLTVGVAQMKCVATNWKNTPWVRKEIETSRSKVTVKRKIGNMTLSVKETSEVTGTEFKKCSTTDGQSTRRTVERRTENRTGSWLVVPVQGNRKDTEKEEA